MWCYRAKRRLVSYLDGELEPRRRKALERHLSSCRLCSAELERLRTQWAALDAAGPVPPMPAGLWGQILTSLDEPARWSWYGRYREGLLRAACVAACITLGFSGGALFSWASPRSEGARDDAPVAEGVLVAEAFDTSAFGLTEGKDGLLRCVPR